MYWYRIDLDHIDKTYAVSGSSELSPRELAEALTQSEYILLSNLVYKDSQRRFQSWREWDPLVKDEMWINPACVIAFQELSVNPKLDTYP